MAVTFAAKNPMYFSHGSMSTCELETFTINGKAADSSDFGDTFDHNKRIKKHYGCCDMRFEPQSPTKEVLAKYNITEEEYNKICDELEDKLCVGRCGWCC